MSEFPGWTCYLVSHGGVYMGGWSIVWAVSEEQAREYALKVLRENNLPEEIHTITKVLEGEDTLIWNGDY